MAIKADPGVERKMRFSDLLYQAMGEFHGGTLTEEKLVAYVDQAKALAGDNFLSLKSFYNLSQPGWKTDLITSED